jgi:hypothetical protein
LLAALQPAILIVEEAAEVNNNFFKVTVSLNFKVEVLRFEVLDVLFCGLKASPVALT